MNLKRLLCIVALCAVWALPHGALGATEPTVAPLDKAVKAMMDGDYAEAVRNYAIASETGSPQAQAGLAIMFASGHGMPVNYLQAYKWLIIAEFAAKDKRPQMIKHIQSYKDQIEPKLQDGEKDRAEQLAKIYLENEKTW